MGRFLSVLIGAVPEGVALREGLRSRPGGRCPANTWDLAPVVWWIRNQGRRGRRERVVAVLYLFVELFTGGLFAAAAYFVGPAWSLPAYLWFISITVVLGVIDLQHRLIPNRILLPGTAAGLVLLAGGAALDGRMGDLPEALATGLGYFLVLLAAAFLLGVFAGYGSWEVAVRAGIGAFVLAGVVAVLLLAIRRLTRDDHLPFGPFMAAAAWIAIAGDLATGLGVA